MKINKINRIYILSFLFTLHISISAYINSTFLTKIISEQYVGLLYTIASIITVVILSQSTRLLKHFGNRKFILWLLFINMLSLGVLITSASPKLIALSFVSILTTNTLVFLCIDIFIEHFGNPLTIGKNRGIYLTIVNIAWMLSPLITAILITQEGGYTTIYIVALITVILMTLGLLFFIKDFKDKKYVRKPFLDTYVYLKKNKHMLAITIINFILQFFFVWMVIYTPLYLYRHMGFGWDQIGVMFTIMLAPFVMFSLPVGILIDKYHIKKRTFLYWGFAIMSIFTFIIPFISTKNVALWALILFMTRVGASITQATSEIYFFTHVGEEDTHLLGLYRDMAPVAYIIAPVFATLSFMFIPFKYLYIVLSIILLTGFYYISHLKHNHENRISN
ncbi:MAG: MFS transporter [Patescibacteria group bacterium]|nr:MFS transporter [Patescibacteria group bacterium]